MRSRYPNCAEKFVFLPNGFDPQDLTAVKPIRPPKPAFSLVHAGAIYGPRTAQSLLEALSRLPADIHLELVGGKCAEVDDLIVRYKLTTRVHTTPAQPHEVALGWCVGADLQIVIAPTRYASPGKLYEYAVTGRPILHVGPDNCAVAQTLIEWGIGRSAEKPDDIAAAILKARDDANNGVTRRSIDLTAYSRQHITRELVRHLNRLVHGS